MSDEEEFDFEAAIKEAIGKTQGGFATEFVLIYHVIDGEGDLKESTLVSDGQLLTTTAGLLQYGQTQTDMLMREGIRRQREEEGW